MKKFTLFAAALAMVAGVASAKNIKYTEPTTDPAVYNFNNWSDIIQVNESVFADAVDGSEMVIDFVGLDSTDPESPSQVQIAAQTVEDWEWTELVSYADIKGTSYVYKIEDVCPDNCDDTALEMLKAHGVNLKGQHASVAKVTVRAPGQGAVNGIEMDEAAGPVEYYNLQGIRVANPEGGIYIARQGSKAIKVMK